MEQTLDIIQPKVSIIVPIFNLESVLKKCIDSIIGQTEKNIEIILVDDGSTDRSSKICDEYSKQDNRVIVVHQKNGGLSCARNTGIALAHGKWIMMIDPDDWLEIDAIEQLFNNAEKNESNIFIASYYTERDRTIKDSFFNISEFHYSTKKELTQLQVSCLANSWITNKSASTNVGVTWARLYNRQFILSNELKFVEGLNRTQDAIFNLYAFQYAQKVDYLDLPVHHYRIWDGSACRKEDLFFRNKAEQIITQIQNFISEFHKEKELTDALNTKTINLVIEIVKIQIIPEKNSFFSKVRILKNILKEPRFKQAVSSVNIKLLNKPQRIFVECIVKKLYGITIILCLLKVIFQKSKYFKENIEY